MLNKIKTEDLLKIYDGDLESCICSQMSELQNEMRKKEVFIGYLLSEGEWSEEEKKRLEFVKQQLDRFKSFLKDVKYYGVAIMDY